MTFLPRSGRIALPLVFAALLIAGCAKDTVRYGDAKGVETVSNQFGSTDLQMIAESMTRSLLNSEVVNSANRPVMTVQEVRNKTSEYIDTRSITDSIRTELQKSGRVRFAVDSAAMQQQVEEISPQPGNPFDPTRHEALMQAPSKFPPGSVVQTLQKGYALHDRTLRPAQVSVSKPE